MSSIIRPDTDTPPCFDTETLILADMPNGVAYCKMLYSGEQPIDFIYLYTNSAFEELTGLKDVTGKPVSHVIPHIHETDPRIIETYNRVVMNGEPEQLEIYVESMSMWFALSIYRPKAEHFVVIFDVITERKQFEHAIVKSEKEARLLAEAMPQIVWVARTDGWNIYFNQQWVEYTGLSLEESYGHGWNTPFHPIDKQKAWDAWQNAIHNNSSYNLECRLRRADGVYRWWLIRGEPICDESGEIYKWFGICTDIHDLKTERKKAEQELRIAATAFESQESIMITDVNGVIQRVNNAFTEITGFTATEVVGQTPSILKSGRHNKAFYAAMWQSLLQTGSWHGEIWDKHKNGKIYPKWMTITAVKTEDEGITHYVAMQTDITARKAAEDEIATLAFFDSLTGLPNRRMFHDRLGQESKKSTRSGMLMALLMIDLDHFKEVNDTLGHDQGDILLQQATQRLLACIRESDTLARLGGDEFTIILGGLKNVSDSEPVAKSIVKAMLPPFTLGEELVYITTSIGITIFPNDATDLGQLLKNADHAMYSAKNNGRSQYCFFTPAMQAAAQNRLRLTNDLRIALACGELELYYQPIVDLTSGVVHKAEALLRWNHPKSKSIFPSQFIPIAEDSGLIHEIGDWVFQEAVNQVKHWRTNCHPDFQISVNKSPVQFHSPNHSHKVWMDYLHKQELPGESIVVEITEGLLMESKGLSHQKLMEFKHQGVQVAIDDFGTGYSSLSYLNRFDIDYLKIDQSFVNNITLNPSDMALCKAIIVMSHELGLKVIAEGVETLEQHQLLTAADCDYGQGFFYARPMPAGECDTWLTAYTG